MTGVNGYRPPPSPAGAGTTGTAKMLGWLLNDLAVIGVGFAKIGLPSGKVRTVAVLFIDVEKLGRVLHESPEVNSRSFDWLSWLRGDDSERGRGLCRLRVAVNCDGDAGRRKEH
jgi:hypothetical protein